MNPLKESKNKSKVSSSMNPSNEIAAKIRTILECAICFGMPFPNSIVKICINAHLVCSTCEQFSAESCHVCRHSGPRVRCRLLEDIIASLNTNSDRETCRYCFFNDTRDNIQLHEQLCPTRNSTCPLMSVPNSFTAECNFKNQPLDLVINHFKFCCDNKIVALPQSNQSIFHGFYTHMFLTIASNSLGKFSLNEHNVYENFINFRPIRMASPFFAKFSTHLILFKRIIREEAVFFFGIRMNLLDEFCGQLKFKVTFAKDEHVALNAIERIISPIPQYISVYDFYASANLFRLTHQEWSKLCSTQFFTFLVSKCYILDNWPKNFPKNWV